MAVPSRPFRLHTDLSSLAEYLRLAPYVIFDCDGLLLDTEPLYTRAAIQLANTYLSSKLPETSHLPPKVKLSIMGLHRARVSARLISHFNLHSLVSADEWTDKVQIYEHELFSKPGNVKLMPGTLDVVCALKEIGLPMAVATSSFRLNFNCKSKAFSQFFADSFDVIVCGDDHPSIISNLKPNPYIFSHTAGLLPCRKGVPAMGHFPFVFEDSANGVVAALRSGHAVIWIPTAEVASDVMADPFAPILSVLAQEDLAHLEFDCPVFLCQSMLDVANILTAQSGS